MTMKKVFGLAAALGLTTGLAACGGEEAVSEDGSVTIEFMHSQVEQERLAVITDLVEKFESEHPDIQVEQVPVEEDAYNTKVVTLASAGQLPEVLEVSQDFARVMAKDQLIDQEAVAAAIESVGADNFYDGALRLISNETGDGYLGLPISGWVQGIWYDKEALASKGFEEPETWDEVLAVAEAFTNPAEDQYGIALPTEESLFSEQAFSQFALSNNANVLNAEGELTINTPEMEAALAYYQELSQYTMPGSNGVTEVNDAFMNNTAPMAIYSTYILPGVFEQGNAENLGFAIPTNETSAVYGTVSALTITAGVEDAEREAAQEFVEFMAQPENMTEWVLMSPGGAQPVSDLVTESEAYQSNEVINAFGDLSTEIASSFEEIQIFGLVDGQNFLKAGDISSSGAIPKMVNSVTVGEQSVEEALAEAESAVKEVIQ
ncbi:ABC transporter substrate-binding protein [Indiicoccus explosivorum]|uniref:ABC transporter substrate-binding protein n=1 Tax=Indiicoccus explosivorum TaxID=1917864 RepID=UPI003B987F08